MRTSKANNYRLLAPIAGVLLLNLLLACSGPAAAPDEQQSGGQSDMTDAPSPLPAPGTAVLSATEGDASAPAARLHGIDVSEFQGEIDWQAVQASGVTFAYARALEGETIHDSRFAANWSGMKEAGVVRGAYDFYVAHDPPEAQVATFISLVTLEPGDLVPMVDIEKGSLGGKPAPADLVPNFHRYLELLAAHYKVTPFIYTDPAFWNENLDDSFGGYPLWVADYGVDSPSLPRGWERWVIWQHSESGAVQGIAGAVDLDVFNGDLQDLARYRIPETGTQP